MVHVLGKKVAIFDWECGQNSAPRDGQKIPWKFKTKGEIDFGHIINKSS